MIKDPRTRIAGGLLLAVLSVLGSTQVRAAVPESKSYACGGAQNLVVQQNGSSARVTFANRSYDLQRKRSRLGLKYESATAALIIDGPSAIFVAEDRLYLRACTEAFPIASER